MVENYVRTPEDEALMERVRKEADLEHAENLRKIEERENLLKEKEALQIQIEEIDRKLSDLE